MMLALIFAGVGLLLLLLFVWLARSPARPAQIAPAEIARQLEALHEFHCRYFPQIRQALSADDHEFLCRRGSRRIQRAARQARLEIARKFVSGLREDFVRLERFGRSVASLSPRVEKRYEWERIRMGVRFRILYAAAQARLSVGSVSVPRLAELSNLIGSHASELERAMAALDKPLPAEGGFTG